MRNYKLLDAIEAYLLADKAYSKNPTNETVGSLSDKRARLEVILSTETSTEDITEMFSDLRAYWDTLK